MNKMNMIVVAGCWDDNGGRKSGYAGKLAHELYEQLGTGEGFICRNGGTFSALENLVHRLTDYNVIVWLADVPNDKAKIVKTIKVKYPHALLVTSKRNDDGKYDFMHLVAHALNLKANLFIEFKKDDGKVAASLFDPLGNAYTHDSTDIHTLAFMLYCQVKYLRNMTRVGSKSLGEEPERTYAMSPESMHSFVDLVKGYAETFHDLIHGANTTRLLGNCSFRCTQGGFPSCRDDDGHVFVSRRNIDKRDIEPKAFVRVEPISMADVFWRNIKVRYYGDLKPSVDTPIQLALYALYPNIRFMLHSHVYVKDAPFTRDTVPCGALQEIEEILRVQPYSETSGFRINLKGHGSLCASSGVEGLRGIPYVARKFPEYWTGT